MTDTQSKRQLLVLGGGPGGYPAAFLAADLGMDVTLIDAKPNPGGICLFEGCIPSKTLLQAAKLINEMVIETPSIAFRVLTPVANEDFRHVSGFD